MVKSLDASASPFPYLEFTPVKSRKNRKNRPSASHSLQRNREQLRKESTNGANSSSSDRAGVDSKDAFAGSWFSQCSQVVSRVWNDRSLLTDNGGNLAPFGPKVLCLGLGSPSASQNASVQLAFLLELCETLEIGNECIAVYDPVFTQEDVLLFNEIGITVMTENKEGDYPLAQPTLCYMLHCDMELYEAILKANWTRENLSNLILIGNSLTDYLDSKPSKSLESTVPCLFRIAPHLHSLPLSPSKQWPTAFNNTCIQYSTSYQGDIFSEAPSSLSGDVDSLTMYLATM